MLYKYEVREHGGVPGSLYVDLAFEVNEQLRLQATREIIIPLSGQKLKGRPACLAGCARALQSWRLVSQGAGWGLDRWKR